MYAMTLGDMTWDIYWYDNHFSFKEYLEEINQDIKGLQIFHTMGNHDNDYKAFRPDADFKAASEYVRNVAPTYYSFNIGKIHYVVLYDIDCSNYDGTESRNVRPQSWSVSVFSPHRVRYSRPSTAPVGWVFTPSTTPTASGTARRSRDTSSGS